MLKPERVQPIKSLVRACKETCQAMAAVYSVARLCDRRLSLANPETKLLEIDSGDTITDNCDVH
jgi:hypothetical protein